MWRQAACAAKSGSDAFIYRNAQEQTSKPSQLVALSRVRRGLGRANRSARLSLAAWDAAANL
jgi:hypothetical protein